MRLLLVLILTLFTCTLLFSQEPSLGAGEQNETKKLLQRRDSFFGRDKLKHFVASAVITGLASWHCNHTFKTVPSRAVQYGFSLTITIGVVKEFVDFYTSKRWFSWRDIIADLAGCITGGLLLSW